MINWLKRALGERHAWEPKEAEEERAKRELDDLRHARQREIQLELGIDEFDSTQAWLRLHELLKEYGDRIKALEDRQ